MFDGNVQPPQPIPPSDLPIVEQAAGVLVRLFGAAILMSGVLFLLVGAVQLAPGFLLAGLVTGTVGARILLRSFRPAKSSS